MSGHRQQQPLLGNDDNLLPASRPFLNPVIDVVLKFPRHSMVSWAFGSGTVLWRIWPAVLMHTLFSALVVILSLRTNVILAVPPVLLATLAMIIGFVISYRAMTGYDRYWMGRTHWSDVIRNTRTMCRLVWYHVPPRLSTTVPTPPEEVKRATAEKRMVLDVIKGFSVALKHHLRGETGIYYVDLFHLIEPLHVRMHPHKHAHKHHGHHGHHGRRDSALQGPSNSSLPPAFDSAVPATDAYGTFQGKKRDRKPYRVSAAQASSTSLKSARSSQSLHSEASCESARGVGNCTPRPHDLKPSMARQRASLFPEASMDLIPFVRFFRDLKLALKNMFSRSANGDIYHKPREETAKQRPRVAGGNQAHNVPLDILRSLSDWVSVLEDRGCVPGSATGGMLGCIASFEDCLSGLERILTTPLPFIYSAHISTVWIFLFFLPFQLLEQFGWSTIPGTAIASFIYLGFMAAGEESEQPFGYDENDLDLDLFCDFIIAEDVERLKHTPCFNTYSDSRHGIAEVVAQRLAVKGPMEEDDLLGFFARTEENN